MTRPLTGTEGAVLGAYARQALESMLTVVDRVDDRDLTTEPLGPGTNSISALVVHSVAVCEFWLGHVALGRPSDRDRESEFGAEADRDELRAIVARAVGQVGADLVSLPTEGGRPSEMRGFLAGDQGDLSLVVHVLEELHQHLGHMEVTADALVAARR